MSWNLIPWERNEGGSSNRSMTAEPFEREFSRMRDEFDNLFHRMWNDWPISERYLSRVGLDVDETDTHYVARMEAPGYEVEDFDVHASGNRVSVKAEHKESQDTEGGSFRRYGSFERTFTIPEGVEADQIEARYHSGILELKIPKGKEAENAKKITVKSA